MTAQHVLTASLLVSLLYLAGLGVSAIVAALRAGGWRDDADDSHPAVSESRFTIPVSVVLPVTGRSPALSDAIGAVLTLNYPELEVIVVIDSATNPDFETVAREWQLQAREFFYRRTVDTAAVQRIHRSQRDSRVVVIDKTGAGYSDALNCGINVARYRYVVSLPPEVLFDEDALLRLLAPALRDPAAVVGVSNHVEHRAVFPRLASARSLMESRLAWSGMRSGLGPAGAVVAWRRDAVLRLRGFSLSAADPDLDMMFRLQTAPVDNADDTGARFHRGLEVFGRIETEPLGSTLARAGQRQRAALGLITTWLTAGAGALDGSTLALFVALEVLAPLAQAWLVLGTLAGAAAGWIQWSALLATLVLLSFGNAAVSVAALLLRGAGRDAPQADELQRLIAAGPLEFVLVRPAMAGARIAGAVSVKHP